jgi:hypothetical protein
LLVMAIDQLGTVRSRTLLPDDPGGKVAIRMRRRSKRWQFFAFHWLDDRVNALPTLATP